MNTLLHTKNKQNEISKRSPEKVEDSLKKETSSANAFASGWDFNLGDINLSDNNKSGEHPFYVQPKLKINQPGDQYEQEADAMAEKVMRMTDKDVFQPKQSSSLPIQRKCAKCEKEEDEKVHRKETNNSAPIVSNSVYQALQSPGKPLDQPTRSFMEQRFGYDFSNVRLHHDSESEESASSIQAKAYTLGNNIVFGAGQFAPENSSGKLLLAHELTHVIQQRHASLLNEKGVSRGFSSVGRIIQTKESTIKVGKQEGENASKASKQLWDDLKAFFPKDVGKVAGSGYDGLIDYLRTSFSNKSDNGGTTAPPVIYVGKKYAEEKDPNKRKELLKREVDSINSWLLTKAAVAAQKLFWDDLHSFFPNDGRKIAGTSYSNSSTYLNTTFAKGVPGTSAPIVEVGKDYVSEADPEKRKPLIEAEIKKIDVWRYDNATIENEDLSDSDLKVKLEDLSSTGKLNYIGKLKEQKYIKNDKVIEYLNAVMQSTPIVPGANYKESGGFETKFDNITITVLPDLYNSSDADPGGAVTKIAPESLGGGWFDTPGWTSKNGKIDSMTFTPKVPEIKYTIQTHYSPGAKPRTTSGYGVGTRPEDVTPEKKTLRSHEGSHGSTFINELKSGAAAKKFPVFTGKIGDQAASFGTALATYQNEVRGFKKMIDDALKAQVIKVDCVGKKITQYHSENGTHTDVHCP